MATFTPIGPYASRPAGVVSPNFPTLANLTTPKVPPVGAAFIPIYPLPGGTGGAGSFAMGLAPLVLPFAALLSWWLR